MLFRSSVVFEKLFKSHSIPCEYFAFYHSVIKKDELERKVKYEHDVCFLGMGFNRTTSPDYKLERELFFNTDHLQMDWGIYGNGWPSLNSYGRGPNKFKGILPPDDIGNLYYSSTSAVGIVAKGQRDLGILNNRYTEMGTSFTHIITPNYTDFDWHGLDYRLYFVDSKLEFISNVVTIKWQEEQCPLEYENHQIHQQHFLMEQIGRAHV